MRASGVLRIASLVALVQGAVHTALFLTARPGHGAEEEAVIAAMQSHHFLFSGQPRSYWDFYFGYGLLAALVVFVEAILFWMLAGIAKDSPQRTRPIVALFILYNIAHATILMRYFFPLPIVMDGLVTATLVWAFAVAGRLVE
ncbi:MAG TPA: hypothetical protein VG867_01495 [Rhizomicrobium sp.]|nr:hypothetical protein [Rhizomicrobium sp.]